MGQIVTYLLMVQKFTNLKQKILFLTGSAFLSSLVSKIPLCCISMNNQACKVRPEIINVNCSEPVFYPFSIKTSKCSGSCNHISDPYANICVPDAVKDKTLKYSI